MNLEAVAERLEQDGVGEQGKTIFINHMPDTCQDGILLRLPFGGTPIDYELPNYRTTEFWVVSRAKDYLAARDRIEQAVASLNNPHGAGTSLTGMKVNYIRATTEPVHFPKTAGNYLEFLVIFEANYVIVS